MIIAAMKNTMSNLLKDERDRCQLGCGGKARTPQEALEPGWLSAMASYGAGACLFEDTKCLNHLQIKYADTLKIENDRIRNNKTCDILRPQRTTL